MDFEAFIRLISIPNEHFFWGYPKRAFFFKRANFASSIYLCSFEARGYIYISPEPPSKSIAYAWCKNIGYRRFFLGVLSLYSIWFKSALNTTTMQRNCVSSRFPRNCCSSRCPELASSKTSKIVFLIFVPFFYKNLSCPFLVA